MEKQVHKEARAKNTQQKQADIHRCHLQDCSPWSSTEARAGRLWRTCAENWGRGTKKVKLFAHTQVRNRFISLDSSASGLHAAWEYPCPNRQCQVRAGAPPPKGNVPTGVTGWGLWLYSFFMLQLLSLPHREIKYQPHTFLVPNCFPGPLQDQACSLPRENTLLLHGRVYEVTEQDRSYSS